MRIRLLDERTGKEDDFSGAGGVQGFVQFINKGKQVLHPNAFHAMGDRQSDQNTNMASRSRCSGTAATTSRSSALPTTSRSATAAPT